MMPRGQYRKLQGERHYAWHFCPTCPNYPTSGYVTRTTRPTHGELCDHCQDREPKRIC